MRRPVRDKGFADSQACAREAWRRRVVERFHVAIGARVVFHAGDADGTLTDGGQQFIAVDHLGDEKFLKSSRIVL